MEQKEQERTERGIEDRKEGQYSGAEGTVDDRKIIGDRKEGQYSGAEGKVDDRKIIGDGKEGQY
jgi:hypothetical protein